MTASMNPSARTLIAGLLSAAIWPAVVLTSIFGVVIEDERDHCDLFALCPFRFLADEPVTDQVPDGFAARRVTLGRITLVERAQ